MAQGLRLSASTAGGMGLVPGQGTRDHIPVPWQEKVHKSMQQKPAGHFSLALGQDFFFLSAQNEKESSSVRETYL